MERKVNKLSIGTFPSSEYQDFENKYQIIKALYEKAESEATVDSIKNKIKDASKQIKDSYEAIEKEKFQILFNDVIYLSDQLKNENNFTVIAPPVQAEDDFVNYIVSATPITTNSLAPHTSKTEFSFDIPTKGGVKVDFSVGPTISIGKNAKDEKYFLEESTTSGKSFLRQRDNNNDGVPGLAAMMHVYKRSGTETAIGGLFGIGAGFQSIKDVDLSFYLGASIILGKMQKVMINTGLSFLRVDRLKAKEYLVDKEYTTQDLVINDVVEKAFKPSLFVSLSYSLAKRVDK